MELREYLLVTALGITQAAIFLLPFIYAFIVAKIKKVDFAKQFILTSGCLTYGCIGITNESEIKNTLPFYSCDNVIHEI